MDLNELFDDESASNTRANAPAEKHLQSPITSSLLDRLTSLYTAVLQENFNDRFRKFPYASIPRDVNNIIGRLASRNISYRYSSLERTAIPYFKTLIGTSTAPTILTPDMYPEYFKRTLVTRVVLEASLSEASELYRAELEAFKKWGVLPELQTLADIELKLSVKPSRDTYTQYECYRYWDFLVERYRQRKKGKEFGTRPIVINDIKIYCFDGFLLEQHGDPVCHYDKNGKITSRDAPKRIIYTYEQLQMLQDASLARFNAYLALDAGMHNGSRQTKKYLKKLLRWQEDVLIAYGNKGYEMVKGPESVAKSYLTTLSDGDVMPITSFVRTIAKLVEKEKKLSKSELHPLTDSLVDIIQSCTDYSTTAELFGCTKLSGHPFVYAKISADSVRSEGCPDGYIDYSAVVQYHHHFKRMVLERYLEIHKGWPVFKDGSSPRLGTRLAELWRDDIRYIPTDSYPLTDWQDVEFGKFMEFDYSPDYLDMIDDKAICPGAQYASDFWFKRNTASSRRLLECLIQKPDVDTKKIVERMRRGKFHIDERIIELTQKEREFKTSARCFCKLTFEVRLFFVLTEANLKRFMGGESGDNGYLPQQTMTMSNTKMRKRLYDMTSAKIRDNSCIVEIDFSRWNLRWRASTVNPIARTLENIFGLPGVFSQAHNFFSSSTIVLTDKHCLPEGVTPGLHARFWPESDLVWRNHMGGFEGIQQTLWTICTIAMMYFALRDEQCSFRMAGQGDNQVFNFTFNTRTATTPDLLLNLLKSIERECERLNHEVKPEECIDSRTVLTYGKEIYICGVHVLYSLKFSSRAFSRGDYTIPSLTKEIAGIVSNSIAVSGTLLNSLRAIWWKHIQVILLLRRRLMSPLHGTEHPGIRRLLRSRNSRTLLLIPGSVGGLPMMPWTRYFSKGETDDLSFDVAATYYLSQGEPMIRNYMSLLLQGEFTASEIDATNLVNDPHSIPIERPNDASHLIADAVGAKLPSLVRNKDIRSLVSPSLRYSGELYKRLLVQLRPLHPQIVSDLFDLTPAGLYNKTVKRFSMTRTIEKLVPNLDMSEAISRASAKILSVLLDRLVLSARARGQPHPTPYLTASKLRSLWKCDLKNSSIGIYTPFDFALGSFSARHSNISAMVAPGADILSTCGKSPPNFGTATRQKLSSHGYRIVNCNSTMRDIKSAVLTFSELQADDSIKPIINSVINARSPWTLTQLVPLFPSMYGGNSVHRHDPSKHHFSVLGSCSVPTHVVFSTDRAGILSGGEYDYPVVFQTLTLTLCNLYQNLAAAHIDLPPSIAYMIPDTLDAIDVSVPKYTDVIHAPAWPPLEGNKLAYVDEMFATEVPLIPDPNLIPHIKDMPASVDLIYSYLETVISPQFDTMNIWDGILNPTDIFDFKEISRVDPYTVETAIHWALITDVFYDLLGCDNSSREVVSLTARMKKRSLIYAGSWVRIRLHPMFAETTYNQRRLISLRPGENGYRRPVEYLAVQFRRRVKSILESRGGSGIPKLILFDNWRDHAAALAKRRLTLAHVLATYPLVVPSELRNSVNSIMPPKELIRRDPAVFVHATTHPMSRKIMDRKYELPDVPCMYLQKSPEESLRMLRDLPVQESKSSTGNVRPRYSHHGIVKYKLNGLRGSLYPSAGDRSPINHEDRLRCLMRRTIGCTSPLYSDWNAVLSHVIPLRYSTVNEFHIFGVGKGAIGRYLCSSGHHCVGYDLQSSFPSIAHRATSYVPPEIALTGNSHLFTWSDHTYLTTGDVQEGDLDIWRSQQSAAVIDLDSPLEVVLNILHRIGEHLPLILRYTGTENEIKYLISLLRPGQIYALGVTDGHLYDVVICVEVLPPIGQGNYEQVEFGTVEEIRYTNPNTELVEQFWEVEHSIAQGIQLDYGDDPLLLAQFLNNLQREAKPRVKNEHLPLWEILNSTMLQINLTGKQMRTSAVCANILSLI